jgi:2-iminobutanoate/2-iminopropanoate deaminase
VKEAIRTDKAPSAIGPYSQAIRCGSLVFVSGQIALNPETGTVEGSISEQTRTVLTYLTNILEAAGSQLEKVVKMTVFLKDLSDFGAMNEIYASFFNESPPARSTFEVSSLPRGARIEIEAIAHLD